MNAPKVRSLEAITAAFRSNGGPANLNADEMNRLWNHRNEMGLTETERTTLSFARQLAGIGQRLVEVVPAKSVKHS